MAEAILTRKGVNITKSFSDNEYELLADYTVGSATSSVSFGTAQNPLRINSDEEIVLVSNFVYSGSMNYYLFVNENSTQSNYYSQFLTADGSSTTGTRYNIPYFAFSTNSGYSLTNAKLTNNGYFVSQTSNTIGLGSSSLQYQGRYTTSTFTLSQINSITITASSSNGLGIGSRFQLYKVKGQVQQTWATT